MTRKDGSEYFRPSILGDVDRFGVAGLVRAVEATIGPNGWHLHIHAIVFTCGIWGLGSAIYDGWRDILGAMMGADASSWDDLREMLGQTAMAARCYARWSKGLKKRGFDCGGIGVDLRRIHDHGAEYLGRYLAKATYDAAHEVAAGATMKGARKQSNSTPFELLYQLAISDERAFSMQTPRHWSLLEDEGRFIIVDTDEGRCWEVHPPKGWRRWWEWESGSKGRRQVIWSRRAKAAERGTRQEFWNHLLDARGKDRDDTDIAADEIGGERLGEISRSAWYRRMVYRPQWLAEALEVAEQGGASALDTWMFQRRVQWTPTASVIQMCQRPITEPA
ncbi:MAG: hypothetical protein QM673_16195 [Gordonia sp. (in: high G+C Gram-positive bacteria)]